MGLLPHDLIVLGLYLMLFFSGMTAMGLSYMPATPRKDVAIMMCVVLALSSTGGILYTLLTVDS